MSGIVIPATLFLFLKIAAALWGHLRFHIIFELFLLSLLDMSLVFFKVYFIDYAITVVHFFFSPLNRPP